MSILDVITMHRFNDSKVVLVGTSLSISDRMLLDFFSSTSTPLVQP